MARDTRLGLGDHEQAQRIVTLRPALPPRSQLSSGTLSERNAVIPSCSTRVAQQSGRRELAKLDTEGKLHRIVGFAGETVT
jgi:hypothetical protein